MKQRVDISPLVAVALGQATHCHKALDRLYQTDIYRYRFYRAAITSPYYKHKFVVGGVLIEVEYTRKALGIITFLINSKQEQNENDFLKVSEAFKKILQRAYPYAYSHMLAEATLVPEKFVSALIKKHKGIDNIRESEIHNNIAVAIYLAMKQLKTTIWDESSQIFFSYAQRSLNEVKNTEDLKPSIYDEAHRLLVVQDAEAKHTDLVQYVASNNSMLQINGSERFHFVFNTLKLSFTSIVENSRTDKRTFQQLAIAYYIATPHNERSEESLRDYIIAATIIYRLVQAYNDVKEYYFANNKESMYTETEELEIDKRKLHLEKRNLEQIIEELSGEINEQDRKIRRLEEDLAAAKNTKTELIALREMVFQQNQSNEILAGQGKNYSELKSLKAVFIGGRPAWQKKMKEFLPNATFIDTAVLHFDTGLLRDTDVYVNTTYINHAIYYRVVENLPESSTLKFLNHDNIDLCLSSLLPN